MANYSRQFTADGEPHKVFKADKHIFVDHSNKRGGKWDVIDLTKESGATTIAEGVKSVKNYHSKKEK